MDQNQSDFAVIPRRDEILDLLKNSNTPLNRNDIFSAFNLTTEEEYTALSKRLISMQKDEQLTLSKNQCYEIAEEVEVLKGYVIGHSSGQGWFRPSGSIGKDADLVLPFHQMKTLLHGDTISVIPAGENKKGQKEARLIEILEKRQSPLVGRYFMEDNKGFVIPDDSRIQHDIQIDTAHTLGARMGNVVIVEVDDRGNRRRPMQGRIIEVLGEHLAPGMETDIAIKTHQIPDVWPDEVTKQVAELSEDVPEKAKKGRVDLRELPLVTIDGEDARDFDDAVYCEALPDGGWKLWVAIADVSYYVRPDSALDKEAQNRGNSVYFPSRVVPMLPEVLSNGLCSLNPQVDRLCMVCEMVISDTGKLSGYKHYEAVMNSHARLTYTRVNGILTGDEVLRERYSALVPHLEELHKMYEVLKKARAKRGAIEFETIETKFIFNAEQKIDRIEPVIRNDAHKLIEECMILANIASASLVEKAKEASLYRVHESPGEERLTGFKDFLAELGISMSGGLEPSPTDYAELVETISKRPDKELIQTMLLRSMSQAIYHADNGGHFGLALKRYAHFTSPIRRYPDLLLHRSIKYLIAKEKGQNKDRWTPTGGYHYSFDDMAVHGEQCSMTERRADDATRDVADWLKCEYMQQHIGDEMDGIIANVTGFGFFVRLHDLHIDGLVHVSTLRNDYFRFDPIGQKLVAESSGEVYRLGDEVKVKVVSVNLEDRQIDFELAGSERTPMRKGKTERKRKAKDKRSKNAGEEKEGHKKARPLAEPTKAPDKKKKPKKRKKNKQNKNKGKRKPKA